MLLANAMSQVPVNVRAPELNGYLFDQRVVNQLSFEFAPIYLVNIYQLPAQSGLVHHDEPDCGSLATTLYVRGLSGTMRRSDLRKNWWQENTSNPGIAACCSPINRGRDGHC